MSYVALKHTHLLLVTASIGLFALRFGARELGASFTRAKHFRVVPHIIDTALLASGVWLIVRVGYPLWPVNWLTVKLALVIAYIGCGLIAMKAARRSRRLSGAGLALLSVGTIAWLAQTKPF